MALVAAFAMRPPRSHSGRDTLRRMRTRSTHSLKLLVVRNELLICAHINSRCVWGFCCSLCVSFIQLAADQRL